MAELAGRRIRSPCWAIRTRVRGSRWSPSSPGLGLTARRWRTHCAGRLAKFKRPSMVRLVDELPRGATGKVQKGQLAPRDRPRSSPPPKVESWQPCRGSWCWTRDGCHLCEQALEVVAAVCAETGERVRDPGHRHRPRPAAPLHRSGPGHLRRRRAARLLAGRPDPATSCAGPAALTGGALRRGDLARPDRGSGALHLSALAGRAAEVGLALHHPRAGVVEVTSITRSTTRA